MAEWAAGLDQSVARVHHAQAAYGALATLIRIRGVMAITPAFVVADVPPGAPVVVNGRVVAVIARRSGQRWYAGRAPPRADPR